MADVDTVEALLRPFDGEQRAGEDPRRTEEFEPIAAELAKIEGVDQETPDWSLVVETSARFLREVGKDLRCAIYWGIGRVCIEGGEAIQSGVLLIRRLLEEFGAECHPRRARARASALAWLAERAEVELAATQFTMTQAELRALTGDIETCTRLVVEADGDPASFNRLRSAIETNVALKLSEEEAVAEVRGRFAPEFADLALTMLEHPGVTANTALGMRLRRFVCWNTIPSASDRVYTCEIAAGHAESLRELLSGKQWEELLAESEALFVTSPWWLDLTYFTVVAAQRTMEPDAAWGVAGALRGLLTRDPALPDGADEAGVPLASEDVREWIRTEVVGTAVATSGGAEELPPEIKDLMADDRLREALNEASPWLAHPDGRIRFARSVALAKAFAARGSASNAHIVFRGLHNHLRQMTVKEWDPPIFTACIEGYLATKRDAFGLGPEDEPLMDELSALDPAALMSILPS